MNFKNCNWFTIKIKAKFEEKYDRVYSEDKAKC